MYCLVYITTSNREEAKNIGMKMVESKLAACANIFENIQSIYRWKGNIENDEETILILKTSEDNTDEIIKKVKEMHSYENPAILVLPIIKGSEEYLNWLENETNP